jgi:hypothetical protein
MAKKLKIWNGASWEDVTFAITPPTTNVTNSFTTNQVIDTSTSVAALRITQRGSGEALRVEDETNPDSSPFVIDLNGNVGIGMSPSGTFNKGMYINSGSGQYAGILLTNSSTGSADTDGSALYISNSALILSNREASSLSLATSNVERMTIAANGSTTFANSVTVNGSLTSTATTTYLGYTQMSGTIIGKENNGGTVYNSNDSGSFSVRSPSGSGTQSATISFHRPNIYAVNMGLDTDNQFKIGGWSGGATDHFVLNFGTGLYVSAARANTAQSTSDGRFRNIYTSTSSPSGGNDGDMWAVYV